MILRNFTIDDIKQHCLSGTSWIVTSGKEVWAFKLPKKLRVKMCDASEGSEIDIEVKGIRQIQVIEISPTNRTLEISSFICLSGASSLKQITAEQFKALQLLVTSNKNT